MKKFDFKHCMKYECNNCKKQRECEEQTKKKGHKRRVGEVNGK